MSLKFAANLSFMFQEEQNLSKRYRAAKDAGFKFVEVGFPYDCGESLESIVNAKKEAGIEQVLVNAYPGDLKNGEMGIAALPHKRKEFQDKLELSIQYARALDCKRMHILAGLQPVYDDKTMEEEYLNNIEYAATRLQKEGILALIEPINSRVSFPKYFLSQPEKALKYVKKVNHPNLKMQFDFFHVQIMDGNLTSKLKEYLPHIGHIQISQVPDRGEPDDGGEINYRYIFKLLEDLHYDGYIGLEYKPRGDTVEGLKWVKEMGYSL
ncbi:putative hydroxypyruvate isomerase [Gigantopelta aegis]|uniref:putative hydroxypyruvate isomerase n=1 Tax=Gigantopelta aegis TaxID=1735272 RepID=UPI001B88CE57|nr:putative hydroxypyruvate isomerase [Gigantopelta aegis]